MTTRMLTFYFYFTAEDNARKFKQAVRDLPIRLSTRLRVETFCVIVEDTSCNSLFDLINLADEYGGTYDGWDRDMSSNETIAV